MGLLKWFTDWETSHAIKSAKRDGDTKRLSELLEGRPDLRDEFLVEARQARERDQHRIGMLYCLAFVQRDDETALEFLLPMLDAYKRDVPWHDLDIEEAVDLAQFVKKHQPQIQQRLLDHYDDRCFEAVGIEIENKSESWLRMALKRDHFWLEASDALMRLAKENTSESESLDGKSGDVLQQHLSELQQSCHELLSDGPISHYIEDMVRQINVLSGSLGESVDSKLLDLLAKKLDTVTSVGMVSVVHLFERNPSPAWIPALRLAWLRMDEIVRREAEGVNQYGGSIEPEVEMAAFALTRALGVCAAEDRKYHDFDADDVLTKDLRAAADELKTLIERHNEIVATLSPTRVRPDSLAPGTTTTGTDSSTLTMSQEGTYRALLHDLSDKIKHLNDELESRHREVRGTYSAGFILRRILSDGQRYAVPIRQGAAWGLYQLCKHGSLRDDCNQELLKQLRSVIHGEDVEEGREANRSFRERRLYVLPGVSQLEMVQTLRDGLQWMLQLAENPELPPLSREELAQYQDESIDQVADEASGEDSETSDRLAAEPETSIPAAENAPDEDPATIPPSPADSIENYDQLDTIVSLLWKKLPEAITFFQHYPLRLMRIDDHKTILGMYTENGCSLEHWTRFEPPKNVGKVNVRYLALDDRTSPNSMGIFYQLFRHPLMVVPVIYHEYLHCAGTENKPGHGIKNEMEVRLREILFARQLVAELAPDDDDSIPPFESELAQVVEAIDLPSYLLELLEDFEDDERLAMHNRWILETYGHQLEPDKAAAKAAEAIDYENHGIERSNLRLTWDRHVRWPLLNTSSTQELTLRYSALLRDRWQQIHWIDPGDRDEILAEPQSREAVRRWQAYTQRPHGTEVIAAACKEYVADMQAEQVICLIARRFEFTMPSEIPSQMSGVLEFIQRAINDGILKEEHRSDNVADEVELTDSMEDATKSNDEVN